MTDELRIGEREDVWTTDHPDLDRKDEEQRERFKLTDLLGLNKEKIYAWLYDIKRRLKTMKSIRTQFEYLKREYQSEMAANDATASASAPSMPQPTVNEQRTDEPHAIGDRERKLLWRHFVKFEDVWTRDDANLDRRSEEQRERFELGDLLRIKRCQIYRWFFNAKARLNTKKKTRREFEMQKRKYQSEMAANDASASASAPKKKNVANVQEISYSEETDPNPLAIVPYEPILNEPIDARPPDWRPPTGDNRNKKRKYSPEIVPDKKAKKSKQDECYEDYQMAALWKHLIRFEDVLITQHADVDRQKEENVERSKLANSIGLTPKQITKWIYNKKSKLRRNSKVIREQFESEKKKYQSKMAAKIASGGKDKASASASAPANVSSAVDLNLNLEKSNSSSDEEEHKTQEDD